MYESFYGLSGKPFSLLPDADFLFFSKKHKHVVNILEYGSLTQAGFIVISGDVGAGKTTALRYYMKKLGPEVTIGIITNSSKSLGRLLQWVSTAFSLADNGKEDVQLYNAFVGQWEGRRTALQCICGFSGDTVLAGQTHRPCD
jgi:hypothetical protein